MATFTTATEARSMLEAQTIANANNIQTFGFSATDTSCVWVISGSTIEGGDFWMCDTIMGTIEVATQEEFSKWVVH
tara:strand:+ start:334 stop:561 length:228 start_codon:yes stop_codon:yes gene_type:complete